MHECMNERLMRWMDVIGLGTSTGDCRGNTHTDSHRAYWGAPDRVWGMEQN